MKNEELNNLNNVTLNIQCESTVSNTVSEEENYNVDYDKREPEPDENFDSNIPKNSPEYKQTFREVLQDRVIKRLQEKSQHLKENNSQQERTSIDVKKAQLRKQFSNEDLWKRVENRLTAKKEVKNIAPPPPVQQNEQKRKLQSSSSDDIKQRIRSMSKAIGLASEFQTKMKGDLRKDENEDESRHNLHQPSTNTLGQPSSLFEETLSQGKYMEDDYFSLPSVDSTHSLFSNISEYRATFPHHHHHKEANLSKDEQLLAERLVNYLKLHHSSLGDNEDCSKQKLTEELFLQYFHELSKAMKESLNPDRISPMGTPSITPTNSLIITPDRTKANSPAPLCHSISVQCDPLGSDEVSRDKDHTIDPRIPRHKTEGVSIAVSTNDRDDPSKRNDNTPNHFGMDYSLDPVRKKSEISSSEYDEDHLTDDDKTGTFTPRTYMTLVPASTVISDDGHEVEGDLYRLHSSSSPVLAANTSPDKASVQDDGSFDDTVIEIKSGVSDPLEGGNDCSLHVDSAVSATDSAGSPNATVMNADYPPNSDNFTLRRTPEGHGDSSSDVTAREVPPLDHLKVVDTEGGNNSSYGDNSNVSADTVVHLPGREGSYCTEEKPIPMDTKDTSQLNNGSNNIDKKMTLKERIRQNLKCRNQLFEAPEATNKSFVTSSASTPAPQVVEDQNCTVINIPCETLKQFTGNHDNTSLDPNNIQVTVNFYPQQEAEQTTQLPSCTHHDHDKGVLVCNSIPTFKEDDIDCMFQDLSHIPQEKRDKMKDLLQELDDEHLYGRVSRDPRSCLSLDSVSLATTPRNETSPTASVSPSSAFPPNYFNTDSLINSGFIDLPDSISEPDQNLDLSTPRAGAISNPLHPPNLQDFIMLEQLKQDVPSSCDETQSEASRNPADIVTERVTDFVWASESDISLPSVPSYFAVESNKEHPVELENKENETEGANSTTKPFNVVEALERIRNSFYGNETTTSISRSSTPQIKTLYSDKTQQTLALPFRLAAYLPMDIDNSDIQRNLRSRSVYYYDFTKRETPYNVGIQCDRELGDYRTLALQQRKSRRAVDREAQRQAKLLAQQVRENLLCRSGV